MQTKKFISKAFMSGIRRIWMYHPVKLELKKKYRKKVDGVFKVPCAICENWYIQGVVEIDHMAPVLPCTEMKHLGPYTDRLLNVPLDLLQILCKKCHTTKTYAEKYNMSFAEAVIEKKLIIMCNNAPAARKWAISYQVEYKNLKQIRIELRKALFKESIEKAGG
jgi:hypothetical protein